MWDNIATALIVAAYALAISIAVFAVLALLVALMKVVSG